MLCRLLATLVIVLSVVPTAASATSTESDRPVQWPASALQPSTNLDVDSDAMLDAMVSALQGTFGITEEQALGTIEIQEQYSLVATDLETRFPDDYAGAWIDHGNDGELSIAMIDPTQVSVDVLAGLEGRWSFVKASRSLDDLREMSEAVSAEIDESVGWASPDLETNGIRVSILASALANQMNDPDFAREVAALVDSGIPVAYYDLDVVPTEASCSSHSNCNPLVAGAKIDGPSTCTSGFKVQQASTGNYGMLTAKHCDPGVYTHYIYNALTSSGGSESLFADVRFLKKTPGGIPLRDDVYAFGNLHDMAGWANPVLYQVLCRTGYRSEGCGVVSDTEVSGHRFKVDDLVACHGDSGGPVFVGSTGYGIFTHLTNGDCPGPPSQDIYAVKISHALAAMDLTFTS
jgi:hypothetical protein